MQELSRCRADRCRHRGVWAGLLVLGLLPAVARVEARVPALAASAQSAQSTPETGAVDASTPETLIRTASTVLLHDLGLHRAEYRKDPAKFERLVDRVLLPHFDTRLAAQLVLGPHWRTATPEQRERFITAFYHSLLRTYGSALLDFTANRLTVYPYRGSADAQYAVVRSRVRTNSGSVDEVDYRLRRAAQGWKVYDVVVEGISYVQSFRQEFDEQIAAQGIEAVIHKLQQGRVPAAAANAGKSGRR